MIPIVEHVRSQRFQNGLWAGLFVLIGFLPVQAQLTVYTVPNGAGGAKSFPGGIAAGPDGALWFTVPGNIVGSEKIGRLTTSGSMTFYALAASVLLAPFAITSGPDGALWFTEQDANQIGRITTSGAVTEYPVPTSNGLLAEITPGPDGALWFTDGNKIGRITTSGSITEYPVPTGANSLRGITAGPDGAVWFVETYPAEIGRITSSGAITEYPWPYTAGAITTGPDGALWFTQQEAIGRITTSGSITNFVEPTSGDIGDITTGPDGALWFTSGTWLGRITTSGSITNVVNQTYGADGDITTGPDGALWFISGNTIQRYAPFIISSLSPASITFGAPAFTLTVNGSGFTPGAAVDWNFSPLPTNYVSAAQVTASVPASLVATPGTATVTVVSGGATSNSASFAINAPLAVNALNPSSVTAGGPAFILTVSGSAFTPGLVVEWNNSPLLTTFLDSTAVIASVPAGLITSPGTATITVVLIGGNSAQAKLAIAPSGNSQCTNIGGTWNVSESGSYTETIAAAVETDKETDPVSGNGIAIIAQTGCSISYNPLNNTGLIGSNLTPSQLAALTRAGNVSGNNVSVTGLLALIDTVASAEAGFTVVGVSSNTLTAAGQVTGDTITLHETGTLVVTGVYSISGQSGPFTETLTTTSTAVFTRVTGPAITSVAVANGGTAIAQNAWIVVKGLNLVPSTTPAAGFIWNSAPDFAEGKMPTQLGGVGVTVNGKAAFIYFYCSAATSTVCASDQINVLTPLDSTTGPVSVVVTNNGTPTAASTANLVSSAPALLQFGAAGYAAATHVNGDLLGPTTLYPGASTPAQPGETIVVYGVGFGMPTTSLLNGSSTQSGPLPYLPACSIGGTNAAVIFAGLISPGLYQINLTVPDSATTGDNSLICIYYSIYATPSGTLIAVQQ